KSQFLASMSHEIRTPLNSVIGFANILEKTYLQPLQRKYLNNITTSAQTLLDIISDILDFSKMEAGKLELESIATDINVFLSDVLDMILFSVNKKNLEFILDVPPDFPDQIHIDRLRLKQVLINLLSNAVKFTERGKIELALRYRLLEEENRVIVKFWVKDSGIGISKENQLKLFQPFTQTDSSITRKYGGTGLGLVISKMILNEMGSNLFLLSKETVGSKFYFSFQTQCKYEDKKTQFSIIKEIHLIGNSTKNNKILNNLLRYHNIQLTYHNEKEGLDFLKNSNSLNIFLIDYNSLNLNGETFLTELTRYLNDNIVTILIHKNNDYETLNFNKLFHKNFYHLTKPLQSKEIIDLLKKIEAALSSQEERISSQESLQIDYESLIINRDENILILLVDDVELNMILLKEFIKLYLPNAEIIEAVNGQDAIEMYETYLPEFVFMDIQMPIVDGYKATREIRIFENQVGREHIPIVALTAGVRDNEVELCQEAGMSDFLKKPINQAQLQDLLRIYFKN
ncbi:MAG: response regulator, partial [Leptospiraceae bacterium]|nr:response regulator [Leptospiraceae bacterium]